MRPFGPIALAEFALALAFLFGALPAFADEPAAAPVLIVISVAGDGAGRAREDRFVEELGLALDRFRVITAAAPSPDFPSRPFASRLAAIRALAATHGGPATIWIEDADGTTLLHLVALGANRALVKMVETRTGPNTEAELALATRELLGEAYLFAESGAGEAVGEVVVEVREEISSNADGDGAPLRFALAALFEAGGGVAGHHGPSLELGAALAAELWFESGLFLRLTGMFESGPSGRLPTGELEGLGFGVHLSLGYSFALGDFGVGPFATLGLSYSRLEVVLARDDEQRFEAWSLHGALGLDLRWRATDFFALVIDGMIGVLSNNQDLSYVSDDSRVITTPRVDWRALAGLAVSF